MTILLIDFDQKYYKMYDAQKGISVHGSYNKMDIPDWWLEVTDDA